MAGLQTQHFRGSMNLSRGSAATALLLALLFAANSSAGTLAYIVGQMRSGEALWIIDFPSFFMAADGVFNRVLSPYSAGTRAFYRQELGFLVLPFLYPPYALPALFPLSRLDYTSGVFVMLAINTIASGMLFYLLHRMFLGGLRSSLAYWSALFLLFLWEGVRETVFVGQVNLFAAVSLLLAWQLLRRGARPVFAGMLIGIAIVTKTYFVLLLLMFLPRLEWRPVVGAAATVAAFSLCALVLVPFSLWGEWLTEVAPMGRYGTTPFPELPSLLSGNQSLNSALIRLIGPGETSGALCLLFVAAILVGTCVPLWRRRHDPASSYFDAILPLMLVTIYLVAPLSWMHHLTFVIPGLLLLWGNAADRGSIRGIALVGIAGVWIGYPWPLPTLEDVSVYLTLLPVPGIAALWVLSLHHALGVRPDLPAADPSPAVLRAA